VVKTVVRGQRSEVSEDKIVRCSKGCGIAAKLVRGFVRAGAVSGQDVVVPSPWAHCVESRIYVVAGGCR
jgi:hypothetical protein